MSSRGAWGASAAAVSDPMTNAGQADDFSGAWSLVEEQSDEGTFTDHWDDQSAASRRRVMGWDGRGG
jgi:hypothetical protein